MKPQLCVNCGKLIPTGAKACATCKAYQPWWRILPNLAVFLQAVAIVTLAEGAVSAWNYVADRNSHTRFKVTSADENHIYLRVWNTGRQPSTLVGYHLHFDGKVPLKDSELDLAEDDRREANSVIAPGAPTKISLTTSNMESLRAPPILVPEQNTKEALGKRLSSQLVVLKIDVEESDDPAEGPWHWGAPRPFHTRCDTFRVDRIKPFILRNVRLEVRDAESQ
jgi:hypothetical protein